MTWRQVMRELSRMPDNKLDGQALVYIPQPSVGHEEAEVFELSRVTTIDGDMAEEYDLVEGDPILLRR